MKMESNISAATVAQAVGFHLLTSEVKDLTPEEVRSFREIKASAVEREIAQKRVTHLREKINAGLGVTFHWVTAELNGETLRGNGQHSSTMLAEFPEETFPKNLKVFREHYHCETPDAFALLFQQFDDRKSSRTASDVAAVYQGFQPALTDVPHDIAKMAVDGYVFYQRTVQGATSIPVGDIQYTLFSDSGLHPFIQWQAELHTSKSKELQASPIVAAMFGTFATNETKAREFWETVSRGGDPDDDASPERVLDQWLLSIFDGDFVPPASVKWRPATCKYQGCVYAWNAFREGKDIASIKYEVKKNLTPIRD